MERSALWPYTNGGTPRVCGPNVAQVPIRGVPSFAGESKDHSSVMPTRSVCGVTYG